MALPASGQSISMDQIRTEFGLSGSISMDDMYRGSQGNGTIKEKYGNHDNVPTSGALGLDDFFSVYKEGSDLQKLQRFRQYRASGLITTSQTSPPSGEVVINHIGSVLQNNPNAGYNLATDVVTNTQTKSNFYVESAWTTIIGIAGMPGGSNRTDPISVSGTETENKNETYNGNANVCVDVINTPLNQLGNISYTYNRQQTDKWSMGGLILISGKYEFNRRFVAQGSGWGINSLNIANNAPSVTLGRDEIAVWARERGGNGASSGWWTSSDCDYIHRGGWWYNTGCWGVTFIKNDTASSTSLSCYNEQPDATWILREVT